MRTLFDWFQIETTHRDLRFTDRLLPTSNNPFHKENQIVSITTRSEPFGSVIHNSIQRTLCCLPFHSMRSAIQKIYYLPPLCCIETVQLDSALRISCDPEKQSWSLVDLIATINIQKCAMGFCTVKFCFEFEHIVAISVEQLIHEFNRRLNRIEERNKKL